MGTKNNPGDFDCYEAAGDDEPLFVLRANDPFAPALVREWARKRQMVRGPSTKVNEALACARSMEVWYRENHGE